MKIENIDPDSTSKIKCGFESDLHGFKIFLNIFLVIFLSVKNLKNTRYVDILIQEPMLHI